MSYNNYVDADAAVRAAHDHGDQPTVAIIKHANPCGIAVGTDVADAHRKAHECDPVSAFGGIIATNRPVTADMARTVADIFTEVVVAPSFDADALELLTAKKNIRLLECAAAGAHRRRGRDRSVGACSCSSATRSTPRWSTTAARSSVVTTPRAGAS